jgi:5-methylcytosine-specific restriction protein A
MHSALSLCGRSGVGIPHLGHTGGGVGKDTFGCPGIPTQQQAPCRIECGAFSRRGVRGRGHPAAARCNRFVSARQGGSVMPTRPPRCCRRCYRLPVAGSPFCPDHQQPVGWAVAGPHAARRLRGRPLQRRRKSLFAREPLCRECAKRGLTTPATIRDHVVPLAEGGTEAPENTQPLCQTCSDAKTHRESLRGRRRKSFEDTLGNRPGGRCV